MNKHRSLTGWQFWRMWEFYPMEKRGQLKSKIGGVIGDNIANARKETDDYYHTCAVRMSHALNCSGYRLPGRSNNTLEVEAGKHYFYAIKAKELRNYIASVIGFSSPRISPREIDKIREMRGIICFWWGGRVRHLDLWDGYTGTVKYNNDCFGEAELLELSFTILDYTPPDFISGPDSPFRSQTAKPI